MPSSLAIQPEAVMKEMQERWIGCLHLIPIFRQSSPENRFMTLQPSSLRDNNRIIALQLLIDRD
jgi:hypothetical protein